MLVSCGSGVKFFDYPVLNYCQTNSSRAPKKDTEVLNKAISESDGVDHNIIVRLPNESAQRHQVRQPIKLREGSMMFWGCLTWWHVGPFAKYNKCMMVIED